MNHKKRIRRLSRKNIDKPHRGRLKAECGNLEYELRMKRPRK